MATMFGFIGNRPDLGVRVLESNSAILRAQRSPNEPLGWGIGFYQSGEVLLRRRPIDEREEIDLAEAAGDVRTDVLIGHVRRATVGGLRTENTHPFRYRTWLFADTGTVAGFERLQDRLLGALPEFLRRNVRGDTDSELDFHLFLSFLHDAGHLEDSHVQSSHIAAALRASIALVDRLSAEEGHPQNRGDIMVTNGELLITVHRGGLIGYRVWKGRYDVEELFADSGPRRSPVPSVDSSHFSLLACDLDAVPPNWVRVPDRSLVILTRSQAPQIEPLA